MIHKLFTSPLKGVIKVGEIIQDEVDRELYDLNTIQHELLQLQLMNEMGEIDEDVYLQTEDELLQRYQIAKERELGDWNPLDEEE